jgi:hypothetical protein
MKMQRVADDLINWDCLLKNYFFYWDLNFLMDF